jgi:hypothetical protein
VLPAVLDENTLSFVTANMSLSASTASSSGVGVVVGHLLLAADQAGEGIVRMSLLPINPATLYVPTPTPTPTPTPVSNTAPIGEGGGGVGGEGGRGGGGGGGGASVGVSYTSAWREHGAAVSVPHTEARGGPKLVLGGVPKITGFSVDLMSK